jgi:hypothetical protein
MGKIFQPGQAELGVQYRPGHLSVPVSVVMQGPNGLSVIGAIGGESQLQAAAVRIAGMLTVASRLDDFDGCDPQGDGEDCEAFMNRKTAAYYKAIANNAACLALETIRACGVLESNLHDSAGTHKSGSTNCS